MVQTRGCLRNGRRSPASIQPQGDTGSDDDFSTPDAGDVSPTQHMTPEARLISVKCL